MSKRIRIMKNVLLAVITLACVVFAFGFPEILFSFGDASVYGRQEKVALDFVSYVKDGSLEEQLKSFAMCSGRMDYAIGAVRVEEGTADLDNEELTQIVVQELNNMRQVDLLEEYVPVQADALTDRSLYTAYITNTSSNAYGARDAITFWSLTYEGTYENISYKMEILMDMEYRKVYQLRISGDFCPIIFENHRTRLKKGWSDDDWSFADSMRDYYGITMYNVSIETDAYIESDDIYDLKSQAGTVMDASISTQKDSKNAKFNLQGYIIFPDDDEDGELYLGVSKLCGETEYSVGILGIRELLQLD